MVVLFILLLKAQCFHEKLKYQKIQSDDFVIVKYDNLYFPVIIVSLNEGGADVKVMTPSRTTYWKWPDKDDIVTYLWHNIIKKINPSIVVSNRVC